VTRHRECAARGIRRAVVCAALALCALWQAPPAVAAAPGPAAKAEIASLLDSLASSGCRFGRNGEWYGPADARSHLAKKYEYLLGKGQIDSTDAFIAKVASQSNASGTPYLVQCGSAPAVESARWLRDELIGLRARRPP
jgi:hypothetical protein